MQKKLRRARHGASICGVCAGVADFFDLNVTSVRLAWVLAVIFGGFGLALYIIMALIVPISEY